jgi:hypothetical protein
MALRCFDKPGCDPSKVRIFEFKPCEGISTMGVKAR